MLLMERKVVPHSSHPARRRGTLPRALFPRSERHEADSPDKPRCLQVESLEGRALDERDGTRITAPTGGRHSGATPRAEDLRFPSAGKNAILNAIFGGAGHEFVTLAEKEVPNILSVVSRFESGGNHPVHGARAGLQDPELAERLHRVPARHGGGNVAGGILLKGKEIELAAITRGPFTTTPFPTYVVFAINRGAGARLGPVFPQRPTLIPDALVTVAVGPDGHGNSATVTDLTTGTTVPLSPQIIQVKGPVVRVLVSAKQLPSEGFKLQNYTFGVYTQLFANAPYEDTGSFLPENSMIPLGVETNVPPPRL